MLGNQIGPFIHAASKPDHSIMFDDRIKQVDFVFQRTTQYKYSEIGAAGEAGGVGGGERIFVLMPEHAVLWRVCRLLPFREQN